MHATTTTPTFPRCTRESTSCEQVHCQLVLNLPSSSPSFSSASAVWNKIMINRWQIIWTINAASAAAAAAETRDTQNMKTENWVAAFRSSDLTPFLPFLLASNALLASFAFIFKMLILSLFSFSLVWRQNDHHQHQNQHTNALSRLYSVLSFPSRYCCVDSAKRCWKGKWKRRGKRRRRKNKYNNNNNIIIIHSPVYHLAGWIFYQQQPKQQ